jgi:hypothetical protein
MPWRSYHETAPAQWFLNGIGMVVPTAPASQSPLILEHLARYGVKTVRTEVGWSNITTSGTLSSSANTRLRAFLTACKAHQLRPIILLNAHHGAPGPLTRVNRTVTAAAAAGDTQLTLNNTSGFIVNYTGLSGVEGYKAAAIFFTAINGNTVTLSKPLPAAFATGANVLVETLTYRPFSVPGSADYQATVAGWLAYIDAVATVASDALGTTTAADKGFDLEIWNELTFGSDFLNINRYYSPPFATYDESSIWTNLTTATVAHADAQPARYSGVRFCDGFGNTIPWRGAGNNAERIRSVSRHPYAYGVTTFPLATPRNNPINALGTPATFTPNVTYCFAEYAGSWVETESALRIFAPFRSVYSNAQHGRYSRLTSTKPMYGWFTETGTVPREIGFTTPAAALDYKARWLLRCYTFYSNKGLEVNCPYSWEWGFSGTGGDDLYGAWAQRNFYDYVTSGATTYPANDSIYVSPALRALKRLTDTFKVGITPTLDWSRMRPLDVLSISDTHDHIQFEGNGTAAHPTLYNRDCLAILPYQVNPNKFVIPYYVMTRDSRPALPPETYTVTLDGIRGTVATATAYDPLTDTTVPVSLSGRTATTVSITLDATDYPRLLILQDSGAWPTPPADLVAQARTPTSVDLTWTDLATDESGYQIERRLTPSGAWSTLTTTTAGTTRWTDNSASPATNYAYRIRATKASAPSSPPCIAATAQTPPAPWRTATLGNALPGSLERTVNRWLLRASGSNIGGNADSGQFFYQPITGNFSQRFYLTALPATDPLALAGLMARADLTPSSPFIFIAVNPTGGGATLQARTTHGAPATTLATLAGLGPGHFVRIERSEDLFIASTSPNSNTWTEIGRLTLALPRTLLLGPAATSKNPAAYTIAEFDFGHVLTLPALGDGLRAEYFANATLAGPPTLTRTDTTVNFNWASAAPYTGGPVDNFSVRWTGQIQPTQTGPWTFFVNADDSVRLWLNGQLLLANTTAAPLTERSVTVSLDVGRRYDLRLEYTDLSDTARCELRWSHASVAKALTPQSRLYAAPTLGNWRALQLATLPTSAQSLSADPDNDGLSNLIEYAYATNPLAATSTPTTPFPPFVFSATSATTTYTPLAPDLYYRAQWSTDLINWTDLRDTGSSTQKTFLLNTTGLPRVFLRHHISASE